MRSRNEIERTTLDRTAILERWSGYAVVALLLAVSGGTVALTWSVRTAAADIGVPEDLTPAPSRLFSRPLEIQPNQRLGADALVGYLRAIGYRAAAPATSTPRATSTPALERGFYSTHGDSVFLMTREPLHPRGPEAGRGLEIRFEDDRVRTVLENGEPISPLTLEPVEIYRYYDNRLIERRGGACSGDPSSLPPLLARAIMAAEDEQFHFHHGVSFGGIARAAIANLAAGEIRQGGSTITQQLARNRFLSHERSWRRKASEALIAIALERRYDKDELLCAYAGLVYFGVRDGVSLVGVGAAAADYFGKTVADLSLAEAATLAGMIAAPSRYTPTADRERVRNRRNGVLGRMRALEWITEEELERAVAESVTVSPSRAEAGVDARYYADAVKYELMSEFDIPDLDQAGLVIDGTLDWLDQLSAEQSVTRGAFELEEEYGDRLGGDFQASLLSIDPISGGVLAYVGGHDYGRSEFDRVRQARRQVGSLFKPIVFAAAFASRIAHLDTPIADRPIAIRFGEELWTPVNSEGSYRNNVTARKALEMSINSATLRLAAHTGLAEIRRQAGRLGLAVGRDPAVVLGAGEASPWEMASVYASFARGGVRKPHTTIAVVSDVAGERLEGPELWARRVLDRETSHMVNTALQGVITRGTGTRARHLGLRDPLAGKTGTSNDRRDSWFVGYSPDRLTIVWTGRDGFGETPLTGTSGPLPIWTHFTLAVRPDGGFAHFPETDLDPEVLNYSNEEVWPVCPGAILHPSYLCADAEDESAVAIAPRHASRQPSGPGGYQTTAVRWATSGPNGMASPTATIESVELSPEAGYELRDLVELGSGGNVVASSTQWVQIAGG